MKGSVKLSFLKKLFTGILPFTFLFGILFSKNIAYTAAPMAVSVLPQASDASLTAITNGQSRDYSTGQGFTDSTGAAKAGRGTISYSVAGDKGILTLSGVDLTTTHGLISANGGNGSLEIVLEGTNSITSNADTIVAKNTNVKFSGTGTLTINQNTAGTAISTAASGNLDFDLDSNITLNQAASESAIKLIEDLVLTKGTINVNQTGAENAIGVTGNTTINGGVLNIAQNTDNNGLNSIGAIKMAGGTVDSLITNENSTGIPIYSGDTITISSTNVRAIGARGNSPYGISNVPGKNITINKGSSVEAVGNTNAIMPGNLVIDDTVSWATNAGQSSDTAISLTETRGTDVANALRSGGQDYVRIYSNINIDPKMAVFDKRPSTKGHTDIIVTLGLGGNELLDISEKGVPLTVGKNYILNYNKTQVVSVTFPVRDNLDNLTTGDHVLTFRFNNGTTQDLTIRVINAGSGNIDKLPKTGNSAIMTPYVLILMAGIFTVILLGKKSILE